MANIPSGYPSAETTGVPAGTKLSVYTGPMTITQDGTVIDGKIINGTLTIAAANVVIKNSQLSYTGWWGIEGQRAKNLTVQDSDIIGPGYSSDSNAGILGSGNFLRNDISKSENGIVLVDGSATVKGNYIHDLQDGSKDPHYDGIAVQGGQNGVLIEGNTIIARNTSSIFIKNDFGPISNVTVKGNFLSGDPGYQIYVDARASGGAITGVQILNNQVQKGEFGYYVFEKSSVVESGNTELKAGQLPSAIPSAPSTPTAPEPSAPSAPSAPTAPEPSRPSAPSIPDTPSNSGDHGSGGGWGGKYTPVNNVAKGTNGNDTLTGTSGADVLRGERGNDTYIVNHSGDRIVEDSHRLGGIDTVKASVSFSLSSSNVSGPVENLELTGNGSINGTGNSLANKIVGNSGNNIIAGQGGNDILTGGAGKDTFVFNTLPNARTNVDKITDFNVNDDTIAIDNGVFRGIGADGVLAASAFHIGSAAHDSNDRVIYNPNTGALIYDSNGSGWGGSVQFATLSPHLNLTNADFQII